MEQFKFDFGKQDDCRVTNKINHIEKYSEVYLINAPNEELITIGHSSPNKLNKFGESHAK